MSKISTIQTPDKQVTKVYAARDYDVRRPRMTDYVLVNLPEYVPTIPRDEYYEQISVQNNFCANKNFPVTDSTIKMTHAIELPLLQGTTCPVIFPKDTPFLLFTPTSRVEEGFLLYI